MGPLYPLLCSTAHALEGEDCTRQYTAKCALLSSNMDGRNWRRSLVIGRLKKPHGSSNPASVSVGYGYNQKAWMVRVLCQVWPDEFDMNMLKQQKMVLLLPNNSYMLTCSHCQGECSCFWTIAHWYGCNLQHQSFLQAPCCWRRSLTDRGNAQGTDDVPDLKAKPLMTCSLCMWHGTRRASQQSKTLPPKPALFPYTCRWRTLWRWHTVQRWWSYWGDSNPVATSNGLKPRGPRRVLGRLHQQWRPCAGHTRVHQQRYR